jgi:hypothetical protein
MRSVCCGIILIAGTLSPLTLRAQVVTPSRVRFDTLDRLPQPAPLPGVPPGGIHICMDCNAWRQLRPGSSPAFIIKDSAAHVLAMIPPGDSSLGRDPLHPALEAEMIATVEVLHDTSLVRVLGRGFENGIVIVTLTPAGTITWRAAAARKATSP